MHKCYYSRKQLTKLTIEKDSIGFAGLDQTIFESVLNDEEYAYKSTTSTDDEYTEEYEITTKSGKRLKAGIHDECMGAIEGNFEEIKKIIISVTAKIHEFYLPRKDKIDSLQVLLVELLSTKGEYEVRTEPKKATIKVTRLESSFTI